MAIANNQYNRSIYPNLVPSPDGRTLVENTTVYQPTNTDIGPNMNKNDYPSKYNTSLTTYPLQLQGTPDLQHYVMFNINIRGSSKAREKYKDAVPYNQSGQNRINRSEVGGVIDDTLAIVGGWGAWKLKQKVEQQTGSAAAGWGLGAAAGAAAAYGAYEFEPDTTYRISKAICLAVNERPSVKYGVDYVNTDMGAIGNLLQGSGSVLDQIKQKMNDELARSVLLNLSQIPTMIASAIGSNFSFEGAASVTTGTTQNPFREQMFKSVDNRTFNFEYKFLPRSPEEAKAVQNIIQEFKYHMHPEISAGGYFYIYPSEFDITYMYKGSQNMNIHKISTCVLENMVVDYGGAGGFHTFGDGMPTEINMRLQFKELEVLTKERIEAGY